MESTVIEVKPIKPEEIEKQGVAIAKSLAFAGQLTIKSQQTYEKAADFLKEIKAKAKELEGERKKITGPIDIAKAAVQALFRKPQVMLEEAEAEVKRKMTLYEQEQEEIRRKEQDRLDKIAAEERAKKEKQEREWREKEEAKRREAEELERAGKAEEARKAREAADKAAAKADDRAFESQNVIAPLAAPKVDKVAGISYREVWYAEVTDFKALPDEYKIANESMINKFATATKGKVPLAGVVFKSKKVLASSTR